MTQREKTIELINKALESPTLSTPGGCRYISEDGQRCIVSQVLSFAGVDDVTLEGEGKVAGNGCNYNGARFKERPDLVAKAEDFGLDCHLLDRVQTMFDEHFDRAISNIRILISREPVAA